MANLVFKKADDAKAAITDSARKEIAALYSKWSDEIGKKAEYYKTKTNASSWLQEMNMRQLQAQLDATSKHIANEVNGIVKDTIYQVSDAVVQANNDWLIKLGFPVTGVESAFVSVPDQTVRRLITGQIYESGWSLSKSIWSDNEDTLKKLYEIVAQGLAQNMTVYDISKLLEQYVDPSRAKQWNLRMADGKNIYKKSVDYNAQRLARTLAQHGYQTSVIALTEKNPFIMDIIWRANGSRVCQLCMDRDGQHFPKNDVPLDHPNGMCVMEPAVDPDLTDKLADWINNPDGTFPEIDAFASEFGYEAMPVKTLEDYKQKYGASSTLSPASYWSKATPYQKMEAEKLKLLEGIKSGDKWYIKNIYNGDGKNLGKLKDYFYQINGIQKPLTDAEKLKQAEAALASLNNYQLTGVWKNPVNLSDYQALLDSGSIQKKIDWYEDQLFNKGNTKVYGAYNDLMLFIKDGKEYAKAQAEVDALKLLAGFTNKPGVTSDGTFSPDLFTEQAKALANRFRSAEAADKFHRTYLDGMWNKLSEKEKYSVWEYTQNSNPINKSLSGYHDGWQRYNFLGLGNTDLGHEDKWRYFDTATFEKKFGVNGHKDYKTVVKDLTNAINQTSFPEGCYLVRGSDFNGLAGILEGNLISFDDALNLLNNGDEKTVKAALEGQVFQNHAFTSTGIASGTGFSGTVKYEIYAPKGTRGIYAEPASYYGDTVGMHEKIYKVGQHYSSIGGEAEVILQRGTSFRITEVSKEHGRYTIKMEIVEQPDYFKTGLEHTHNNGATSYKK